MAKTNYSMWIVKAVACSLGAGAIFWYAGQHSVAFNDILTTFASIPAVIIVLIEIIDKVVDMKDVFNTMYSYGNNSGLGYAFVFLGAIFGFLGIIWALAGTITLNVGSISPAVIIVAGLLALYILAPETGDDEIIAYLWLGATIATMGKYLTLIPNIPGLS